MTFLPKKLETPEMIDRIVSIRLVVQRVAVQRIMTFSPVPFEDDTTCKELYLAEKTGASRAKNISCPSINLPL